MAHTRVLTVGDRAYEVGRDGWYYCRQHNCTFYIDGQRCSCWPKSPPAPTDLQRLLVRGLVSDLLHLPLTSSGALEAQRWSAQGLGMLRHYLSKELRLHVWDRRLRVANVSSIHDHPWSFTSYVVSGRIINVTYERCNPTDEGAQHFKRATIQCGSNACVLSTPTDEYLREGARHIYEAGEAYTSSSDEIHESLPKDGTITLIHRTFDKAVIDQASVWWPGGEEWVSAEPRPATPREVLHVLDRACSVLDGTHTPQVNDQPAAFAPA